MLMQARQRPFAAPARVSNAVLGVVFLLATEIMLFAGFVSAYIVTRAQALSWPPPDQPRLAVAATAVNTLILLASGVTMWRATASARHLERWLLGTLVLGGAFLALQGSEWARLLSYGLTAASSSYGGFFYLIIGAHALHALAGLVALVALWRAVERSEARLSATALYWYFVVGLWPILYISVYLV